MDEPEQATKFAIARRAKSSPFPGRVRPVFTWELRQELAVHLAAHGIRVGKNIKGVIIDLLEAGARRWQ